LQEFHQQYAEINDTHKLCVFDFVYSIIICMPILQ
jgi:hypothetical protein